MGSGEGRWRLAHRRVMRLRLMPYGGRITAIARAVAGRGRGHLGHVWGGIVCAMTMPTFADVDEALAKRDYRAALDMLESMEVVGEDACYRRDIQAAACADRLGLYPLLSLIHI